MAGAGYKLFNTGDVLLASEVNTYLMQQTVMVFASAAARTTALSGVVAEGMLSYLKDTDVVEVYNGSAWVASDDPNAIQNSIVDAKGDLISATADNTPARLASSGVNGDVLQVDTSTATGLKWAAPASSSPLTTKGDLYTYSTTNTRLPTGNNGEQLLADSGATTGLRWTATPSANNPQINGAFDIWQRGTSVSVAAGSNSTYTADRFIYNVGANQAATVSRQATGDTTNLPFIQYCARVQRNSGQTGTGTTYFISSWESVNSIPFAGKTVTMSFYARKGANYSATSDALTYKLVSGTGTDQNESISGFTGAANVISQTATLTSTWQRFSASGTVATTATQLATEFLYIPTGTAGANDYYEISGIQVDVGSVALPFRRNGDTIQGELAACCRYYQRLNGGSSADYWGFATGTGASTGVVQYVIPLPIQMRIAPTSINYSALATYDFSSVVAPTSVTLAPATQNVALVNANKTGSFTVGKVYQLLADNSSSAYLAFNAEL